jgi:hypothetical protein
MRGIADAVEKHLQLALFRMNEVAAIGVRVDSPG